MTPSEIRSLLVKALSESADCLLAPVGFSRVVRSTEFTRRLPTAKQAFDISLALHPAYFQGALAHIHPRLKLTMPDVCQIAARLVDGNSALLANAPNVMVNRPLEHFVPKSDRVQWYAFREEDFSQIAHDVADSCVKWGLPFFNDYQSAKDVVLGFEAGDERLKLQENWAIFVVAAHLILGQQRQAKEVLESTFVTPGSRKKYATVFENIRSM